MAIKKRRTKRYRLIVCLVLSILCWFAVKMSKSYTQVYHFDIEFVNLPKDKSLIYQSDTTISVTVDGKGIFLLKYEVGRKKIKVDYSLVTTSDQRRRNYVTITKYQLNTYLVRHLYFPENSVINDLSQINLEFESVAK